jgi:superfamily II DNA helicase RecQ
MLPALCSSGVAMVIMPLTLLRDDMMERWKLVNIGCVAWDSWRPAEWASIMLVTPESAVTQSLAISLTGRR